MAFSFIYNLFLVRDSNNTYEILTLNIGNERLGGFGFNVNRYVGFVIVILASIPLALRRNILNPVFLLFLFIIFSVIGSLSGSRSFFITYILLIVIILFFLSNKQEYKSIKIFMFLTVFLIICFSIINYGYLENQINEIDERSKFEKIGGYSRLDLVLYYVKYLFSNPGVLLFGYGINSYFYKVGYVLFPHNLIIEPFMAWGLVGVIILIMFFYQLVLSNSLSSGKQHISLLTVLPVSCFLVQSLFSSPWAELDFYIILVYCIRILFIKD